VTGAAGRIGSDFAAYAAPRFDLRLSDRPGASLERLSAYGETVPADLGDLDALTGACQGIDTVVHLGADPNPDAGWTAVLDSNIVGCFNLFTAAQQAGCRRVVYASSVHAVIGHPAARQVRADDPVWPTTLYGVSKCFGEALGRQLSERGVSVIVVRIGAFENRDLADLYVSAADLNRLLERAILVEEVGFAIVNATSDNARNRLDPTAAIELLGYRPE
jgi:uronate dehydrogenase